VGSSPIASTQFLPALFRDLERDRRLARRGRRGRGVLTPARQRRAHRDGTRCVEFVFSMAMARRDLPLLEALRSFLGYGAIQHYKRGREHWQPTNVLRINAIVRSTS
jgi:hypothetical protein